MGVLCRLWYALCTFFCFLFVNCRKLSKERVRPQSLRRLNAYSPGDCTPTRASLGTPAAAISVLLSPCVGLGCFSTFFPLLLLAAEVATQPSGHIATQPVTATVMRSGVLQPRPPDKGHGNAASGPNITEGDTGGLPTLRSVPPPQFRHFSYLWQFGSVQVSAHSCFVFGACAHVGGIAPECFWRQNTLTECC